MPTLTDCLFECMEALRPVFSQSRMFERIQRLMLTGMLTMGDHFITRMIATGGRDQQDWTSDYRVFSQSPWEVEDLFQSVLKEALKHAPGGYISVGLDDTALPRTGKRIPGAQYMRDALSPPFHTNFIWGLRFIQFSLLLPLHEEYGAPCRGIPVRFAQAPIVKKPGKRASEDEHKAYLEERKRSNLSRVGVAHIKAMREAMDRAGEEHRRMLIFADGSYCNQTTFRADFERTSLVARARKDAAICFQVAEDKKKGPHHLYGERFTPESILLDKGRPYEEVNVYFGGQYRDVKYKEVQNVYWPRGAQKKPLRLIVLAPTSYKAVGKERLYYRSPAYLLTTDLDTPVKTLIQGYIDRWQIEVNHRDEKSVMGVGQAQVWNWRSVERQPAFVVASYSLLLLAGLTAFGPERGDEYEALPRWRKNAKRPSCLDLVQVLRRECIEQPQLYWKRHIEVKKEVLIRKASA